MRSYRPRGAAGPQRTVGPRGAVGCQVSRQPPLLWDQTLGPPPLLNPQLCPSSSLGGIL